MQLSFHLDYVIILWKTPTLWLSDLHHQKVAGFQISPFHTIAIILKATLFDYHLYSKDFHSNITSNETTIEVPIKSYVTYLAVSSKISSLSGQIG